MSAKDLAECLDLLKDDSPTRSTGTPPVGKSKHHFYSGDDFKRFLFPNVRVVDHDVGKTNGQANQITFVPTDVRERVDAARSMFPGGQVQIEIDFFYPREDTRVQVGHVGFSDFKHRYWPIAFAIAPSEDKESCMKLLQTAIDLIEDTNDGE